MLKKSEKGGMGTSSCSMCVHKVSRKNNFFVACGKKPKNYVEEHYLEALKFVFFLETKQKDIFSQNFVSCTYICEHVCMEFSFDFQNLKTCLKCILQKVGAHAHEFRTCLLASGHSYLARRSLLSHLTRTLIMRLVLCWASPFRVSFLTSFGKRVDF